MSIAKGYVSNFETLRRAFRNGDAALLECIDKRTGRPVIALCAVEVTAAPSGDVEYTFKPLAKLFDGNPYDELVPPALETA